METSYLTLQKMGLFGSVHGWGVKRSLLPKFCHTYSTMMNLGTVTPYLKKIQKYLCHVTHPLVSSNIVIFLPEISKFSINKKCRYRLHFDTQFFILLTFFNTRYDLEIVPQCSKRVKTKSQRVLTDSGGEEGGLFTLPF